MKSFLVKKSKTPSHLIFPQNAEFQYPCSPNFVIGACSHTTSHNPTTTRISSWEGNSFKQWDPVSRPKIPRKRTRPTTNLILPLLSNQYHPVEQFIVASKNRKHSRLQSKRERGARRTSRTSIYLLLAPNHHIQQKQK